MANDNQALKAKAAPGASEVIEWALIVHRSTMDVTTRCTADGKSLTLLEVETESRRFTLDEREEARKLLIEYGAGKPTRIVEHRGSNRHPIAFKTTIVGQQGQLPSGEPDYIPAEVVSDGGN